MAAPKSGNPKSRKKKFMSIGGAGIGSAMAGLEAAAFRSMPPPIEVVESNRHDGVIATDDGKLVISIPEPADSDETPRR